MKKPIHYILAAVCLLFTACSKQVASTQEKRIKEGPTVDFGAALPEIMGIRNDTANIALFPSAQVFFIDLGLKGSAANIKLIKQAKRLNIPVRAKLFKDNSHEIAEIYPATKADLEKYKEAMIEQPVQIKKPR